MSKDYKYLSVGPKMLLLHYNIHIEGASVLIIHEDIAIVKE